MARNKKGGKKKNKKVDDLASNDASAPPRGGGKDADEPRGDDSGAFDGTGGDAAAPATLIAEAREHAAHDRHHLALQVYHAAAAVSSRDALCGNEGSFIDLATALEGLASSSAAIGDYPAAIEHAKARKAILERAIVGAVRTPPAAPTSAADANSGRDLAGTAAGSAGPMSRAAKVAAALRAQADRFDLLARVTLDEAHGAGERGSDPSAAEGDGSESGSGRNSDNGAGADAGKAAGDQGAQESVKDQAARAVKGASSGKEGDRAALALEYAKRALELREKAEAIDPRGSPTGNSARGALDDEHGVETVGRAFAADGKTRYLEAVRRREALLRGTREVLAQDGQEEEEEEEKDKEEARGDAGGGQGTELRARRSAREATVRLGGGDNDNHDNDDDPERDARGHENGLRWVPAFALFLFIPIASAWWLQNIFGGMALFQSEQSERGDEN